MSDERVRGDAGFRWRGREISRIEGLSDAVFAFAVTLLVVSLEVPRNFGELEEMMHGFVAFAASFAVLVSIWHAQYKFFRRYALEDSITVLLSSVLLFVVLFYVYPLKFLFNVLISAALGNATVVRLPDGRSALAMRVLHGASEPVIRGEQWPKLMIVYGLGYVAIYTVFVMLYWNAYRFRAKLGLNAAELFDTRTGMREHALMALIGLVSLGFVVIGGPPWVGVSGWTYAATGPVMALHGVVTGMRRARKYERPAAAAAAAEDAG